jgi:hypothetical protein
MFLVQKVNIFSPLHVKNKPHDGETEHAFILGSMHCMLRTLIYILELWLTSIYHKKWHFKLSCTVLVVHNTVSPSARLLLGDIGFVYPVMSMVVIGPSLPILRQRWWNLLYDVY